MICEGAVLKDDPYIFLSHTQQLFHVEDENDKGWERVIRVKPRDTYHLGSLRADDELYPQCMPPNIYKEDGYRDQVN